MKKKDLSPKAQKVLALDIGSKRIGLAIWDPGAQLARSHPTLHRRKIRLDLELIAQLIGREQIEALVVGWPLGLNETLTESTRNAEFWIETLGKEFGLPVYKVDESFSTQKAIEILKGRGVKLRSQTMKEKKDSLSAQIFLEEFMRGQV